MNLKELFDIIKSPDNVSKLIIVISIFIIFIFPEKIIKILNLDELIKKYGSMLGLVLIILCVGLVFNCIKLVFNCIKLVVNVVKKIHKQYRYKKTLKKTLYNLDHKSKQIILVLYFQKTYKLNTFDSYVSYLRKYGIIKACNEFAPIKYSLMEDAIVAKHLYRLSEQVIELLENDNELFNSFQEAFKSK